MNKIFKFSLICLMLVLGLSCLLNFSLKKQFMKGNVSALEVTQKFDDGIILSVEKVLVPEVAPGDPSSFKNIKSENGDNYFRDIPRTVNGIQQNKYVVLNNEFVMLEDVSDLAGNFKQKIMVTLNGYYYNSSDALQTNSNSPYSNLNNLTYLLVSATRDYDESIVIPANRQYTVDGNAYYDFVCFIDAEKSGKYDFNFKYNKMQNGSVLAQVSRNISFYVMNENDYVSVQTVSGQDYSTQPSFVENTTTIQEVKTSLKGNYQNDKVNFFCYDTLTNNNYPILTYDCDKFAISIQKIKYEKITDIDFYYDKSNQQLVVTETTQGAVIVNNYDLLENETIVSIVFTELADYLINSQVIYYDAQIRMEVDSEQVAVKDQKLIIYGASAVYSRQNTYQCELKRLEIAQNGTNCVVLDGIDDDQTITSNVSSKLGTQYSLVPAENRITGAVLTETKTNQGFVANGNELITKIQAIDDNENNFVKTNQGPVWFDVVASVSYNAGNTTDLSKSHYYYAPNIATLRTLIDEECNEFSFVLNAKTYLKDMVFRNIGYYVVVLNYTYTMKDVDEDGSQANVVNCTQIFAFAISSKSPNFVMISTPRTGLNDAINNDGDVNVNLASGEYTNKNVFLSWNTSGAFDTDVIVRYWFSSSYAMTISDMIYMDEYMVAQKTNGKSYGEMFSNNGSYLLEVGFGTIGSLTQRYRFNIDKTPISNIELRGVEAKAVINSTVNYYITNEVYSQAVIDKDVALTWVNKESGAAINAEYTFTPFIANESAIAQKSSWVTTNYSLGTTSPKLVYQKAPNSGLLNKNYIMSAQGIYLFNIFDTAGNSTLYMVVVDKTEARFVQTPTTNSLYNLVNESATITFGSHKAISLENMAGETEITASKVGIANLKAFVEYLYSGDLSQYYYNPASANFGNYNNIRSLIQSFDSVKYFAVKNLSAQIEKKGSEPKSLLITSTQSATQSFNIDINNETNSDGEGSYQICVISENQVYFDRSTNQTKTTSYEESRSTMKIMLSMDTAGGTVFGKNDDDLYSIMLSSFDTAIQGGVSGLGADVSSRKQFVFEWWEGNGDQKVVDVSYLYYPLDLTSNSDYYPYSALATTETPIPLLATAEVLYADDMSGYEDASERLGKLRSLPLNLTYETFYDNNGALVTEQVTATGMYVITRTFENTETRSYRFYVDRNSIITFIDGENGYEREIGKAICVKMQNKDLKDSSYSKMNSTTEQTNYTMEDASIIKATTIATTNLMPLKFSSPRSKYTTLSSQISKIVGFNLDVDIFYQENASSIINKIANETLGFKTPGTYIFKFNDNCGEFGLAINDFSQRNEIVFAIKIVAEKPEIEIYGKPTGSNGQIAKELDDLTRTTDEYVTFVIEPPQSEYMAEIDIESVSIKYKSTDFVGDYADYLLSGNSNIGGEAVDYSNRVKKNFFEVSDMSSISISAYNEKVIKYTGVTTTNFTSGAYYLSDGTNWKLQENFKYRYTYILNKYLPSSLTRDGNIITNYPEYEYKISVQFIGNSTDYEYELNNEGMKSFYSNEYRVIIDRTPSQLNVSKLINGQKEDILEIYESLTQASQIAETSAYRDLSGDENLFQYEDYYSTYMTERFAFVVSDSTAYLRANSVGVTEITSTWYRKLKLTDDDFAGGSYTPLTRQAYGKASLLPGDPRYYNPSTYNNFLRFVEASAVSMGYYSENSKNTFKELLGEPESAGYYEIIEKDAAGNYTSYIVLYNPKPNDKIQINANCSAMVAQNNVQIERNLNAFKLEINKIINVDYFSTITLDTTINGTVERLYQIQTNFDTDFEAVIEAINLCFNYGSYTLKITSRYTDDQIWNLSIFDASSSLDKNAITKRGYGTISEPYYITPADAITTDIKSGLDFSIKELILELVSDATGNVTIQEEEKVKLNINTITSAQTLATFNDSANYKYIQLTKEYLDDKEILWKNVNLNLRHVGLYKLTLVSLIGEEDILYISTRISDEEKFAILHESSANAIISDFAIKLYETWYASNYAIESNFYYNVGTIRYTTRPVVISYPINSYASNDILIEKINENEIPSVVTPSEDLSIANSIYSYENIDKGLKYLIFMPASFTYGFLASGSAVEYDVKLKDDVGNEKIYHFVIDNSSPAITFKDVNNISKNNIVTAQSRTSYTSTAEAVNIVWDELEQEYFNLQVLLKKKIVADDGIINYNVTDISSFQSTGFLLAPEDGDEGSYILELNIVNPNNGTVLNNRYFSFTIRLSDSAMYYVEYSDSEIAQSSQSSTTWQEINNYAGIGIADINTLITNTTYANDSTIEVFMSYRDLNIVINADKNVELKYILAPSGEGIMSNRTYSPKASGYKIYLCRIASLEGSEYVYEKLVCLVKATDTKTTDMLTTFKTTSNIELTNRGYNYYWYETGDNPIYSLTFNKYNVGSVTGIADISSIDTFAQKNRIMIDVYYRALMSNGAYNDILIKSTMGDSVDELLSKITFENEGVYKLVVRDLAGNVRIFSTSTSQNSFITLNIMKKVIVNANDKPLIENGMYQGQVVLSIANPTIYVTGSILFTATQNGQTAIYTRSGYSYTFSNPGTYRVIVKATYEVESRTNRVQLIKEFVFTIINANEARVALDFTNIHNSYEISSVIKNGKNITSQFLALLNETIENNEDNEQVIQSSELITYERLTTFSEAVKQALASSRGIIGAGVFTLTYSVNADNMLPAQTITITFWINNESPSIISSIKAGEATTKQISINYNPYIIHQQVGDCYIKINNRVYATIDEQSASNNNIISLKLNDTGKYIVQIVSDSGAVISSFAVTKNEPLNSVSIALIVIACTLVVSGVALFIIIRKRVKVR